MRDFKETLNRLKDENQGFEETQGLEEAYFGTFDKERICIDKVFFVVYDEKYATEDHTFDKVLRDKFIQHVKRSRIKKGRFEQVLRREQNFSSWELKLGGARTMYFHVNVIHYLQEMHDIRPSNVIYDDNFLPIDCKLSVIDFVSALRTFVEEAKNVYHDIVLRYWGEDLQNIQAKLVQVEIPYEIYPASVDDISRNLYAKGISFRKYNTQSGTIYLNHIEADNEIKVPERKYDKEDKVSDRDLAPDIVYLNKIDSGRSTNRIQIKIYQKTFGLVRIEFTVYSDDAKILFNWSRQDQEIAQDLIGFSHYNLQLHDINVERYDRSLDDVVRFLATALKENEDLIYSLKDLDIFEANVANRNVRQRLVRKGILMKRFDSDGIQKRGQYIVNPIIREFLNMYKAKGNEHFIRSHLFPSL